MLNLVLFRFLFLRFDSVFFFLIWLFFLLSCSLVLLLLFFFLFFSSAFLLLFVVVHSLSLYIYTYIYVYLYIHFSVCCVLASQVAAGAECFFFCLLIVTMTDFPKLPRIKSEDENMEKIHVAARKGQTEEVRRLIELGVSPTIQNRFGCTALHLACKFGCVETAKFLASVAEVHSAWHGQKPIHLAVLSNKPDLVKALVEGAKMRGQSVEAMLNECDEREVNEVGTHVKHCKGQTALHWCVGLGPEYLSMIQLLVQLGASPTAKDRGDETPLMRAMEFQWLEALDTMLDGVVNKNALRLDLKDKKGRSHLHWAILTNNEAVALRFIEMGHDVNMEDAEHVVPLYLAVRAAMVTLTAKLVEISDVFLVQNCPFHNGTTVMRDRIAWLDFVPADTGSEAAKAEVIRLFQEKLSKVTASLDDGAGGTEKKKKKSNSIKPMNLAPSAPYRDRSRSRMKSTTSKRSL